MTQPRLMICPYCGHAQRPSDRCQDCETPFAASSRRATLDQMGPWFVRDVERPFRPGCSHATLVRLVEKGVVGKYTIVRGPTTRQLWTVARHVPGLAHLLGYCHACDAPARPEDVGCHHCGATFTMAFDRDALGVVEAERDAATAPGRSVGFVPTARNRLSSFAPDEEIVAPRRGVEVGEMAAIAARATGGATADAQATEAHADQDPERGPRRDVTSGNGYGSARIVGGEHAVHQQESAAAWHAVERSLRFELRRQRGIIRTMGICILLVASLAGWLGWQGWQAARRGAASVREPASGAQEGRATSSTPEAPPAVAPAAQRPVPKDPTAASDDLQSIEGELQSIGAQRAGSPDERRAQLDALVQRLEAIATGDPQRVSATRAMIDRARAQLELEAALGGGA